ARALSVIGQRNHLGRDEAQRTRGIACMVSQNCTRGLLCRLELPCLPIGMPLTRRGLDEWVLDAPPRLAVGPERPVIARTVRYRGAELHIGDNILPQPLLAQIARLERIQHQRALQDILTDTASLLLVRI